MVKVYAPNRAYNGISAGVVFTDGVGETDSAAALAYFRRARYGIGEEPAHGSPAPDPSYELPPASVKVGTALRDASVEPLPKDFLPPTNAGKADPHGPLVVAPGLHAVPPAPIVPGPVAVGEPRVQEAVETAVAHAVLVEGQPATVTAAMAGPRLAREATREERAATEDQESGAPKASANKPEWVAYAIAQGMDADEANAAKKVELVERFGG